MRDLYNLLQPAPAFTEANVKATAAGPAVNIAAYDGGLFAVDLGVLGDTLNGTTNYELHIQESQDGSTGWADAPAMYVQSPATSGNGPVTVTGAASTAEHVVKLGYLGYAPFVRLNVVVNGTMTNGTVISALAILGFPRHGPAGVTPQVP